MRRSVPPQACTQNVFQFVKIIGAEDAAHSACVASGSKERVLMAELVDGTKSGWCSDVPRESEEQSRFSTDHLYLTGFLICCGHNFVSTSSNGSRISFEFSKTPALLTDVARYMSGALVPARQFSFEILRLKRTIHGG